MTRRHLSGVSVFTSRGAAGEPQERDPALAVALARLEACAIWRDTAAAARALDAMAATPDGAWLLLQMTSAGLRALSTGAGHLPTRTVHTDPDGHVSIVATAAGISATSTQERTRW